MADGIFGQATGAPLVVKGDNAIVTVDGDELLATQVQISYQRNVQRLPVVGKKDVLSVGKAQGVFTAEAIYAKSLPSIFNETGCDPKTITVKMSVDDCNKDAKDITLFGCVASALQISLSGERGYIASGVTITFTSMKA